MFFPQTLYLISLYVFSANQKKTVKKYINKLTIGGRTVIKVMAIILIISFIQVDCIEWY